MRMRDSLIENLNIEAHLERLFICASSKLAIVGASTAGISGATARIAGPSVITDVCGIVGATMGVIFTLSSVYLNWRKNQRHELRLKQDRYYAEQRNRREEEQHNLSLLKGHPIGPSGRPPESVTSELLDD